MMLYSNSNQQISRQGLFLAPLVFFVLLAAVLVSSAVFVVKETDNVLVMQLGRHVRTVSEPGLYFLIPVIQKTVPVKKTLLSVDLSPEEVITADQKRLVVDAFVWFRIDDPLKFYKAVKNLNGARMRLSSITNSVMREVLATETFAKIFSAKRLALMSEIRDKISVQSVEFGIKIVDTQIKRTDLPEANSLAIYRRMQTDRQKEAKEIRATGVERARYLTSEADRHANEILASARRQAEITRGEGDAESMRIKNRLSSQYPDFYLFYQALIAYRNSLLQENTLLVMDTNMEFLKLLKYAQEAI